MIYAGFRSTEDAPGDEFVAFYGIGVPSAPFCDCMEAPKPYERVCMR